MAEVYRRMAEELPPPYEVPMADEDPPLQLVIMLYHLMRDYIPPGYVEGLVREGFMGRTRPTFSNPHLRDYADRLARQLTYTDGPGPRDAP